MDFETRISKVEAIVETTCSDNNRLHQAIVELRRQLLEWTDRLQSNSLDGLRELGNHIAASAKELRDHLDESIKDLRLLAWPRVPQWTWVKR